MTESRTTLRRLLQNLRLGTAAEACRPPVGEKTPNSSDGGSRASATAGVLQEPLRLIVLRILRLVVAVYLGLLALLVGCQRRLIYFPSRHAKEDALQMARQKGMEPWHDADGELAGWRRPAPENGRDAEERRRVLIFHGNAGHALHRTYFVEGFENLSAQEWDVIVVEYPGYGARPGKPSEPTITEAAISAFAALMRENPAPIYLVGESLGSGPACRLAAEYPEDVAGIWLVTPFSSLVDAARTHYPFLPVRLLLRDRYDNVSALREYHGRLVVLTAGLDQVVPPELGRRLYKEAATPYKKWIQLPGADHNTLDLSVGAPIWSEIAEFWTNDFDNPHPGPLPGPAGEGESSVANKPLRDIDEASAAAGRKSRQGGETDD